MAVGRVIPRIRGWSFGVLLGLLLGGVGICLGIA